uniref:Drought induced 19 protein type zinc-binding domain-containing protein n=1 Tax=Brassica campestris TaxID=3711 RepID=M4EX10_BRACM
MDDDMWAVSSSGSSRSHRSAATTAKFQSGSYLDSGDFEEDEDDVEVEYPCPFCSDDYDLVELCHHIDEEHSLEATHGVCPVCSKRVKMHMVDHITTHHRDKETYEDDPYSSSDNYLQDDLSPSMNHHHTSKTDQFLSFLNNSPLPNQTKPAQEVDSSVEDKTLVEDSGKDRKLSTPLSDSEQLEKAKKCEFVQGLLSSAMFDDGCDFF